MAHRRRICGVGGGYPPRRPRGPLIDDRLLLRPDPGAALRWAMAATLLVALTAWIVADGGGWLAWLGLAIASLVGGYFLLQLLVPRWFAIACDEEGLAGRNLTHCVVAPWRAIRAGGVTRVAGDDLLRLDIEDGGATHRVALILPVGADAASLEALLARRTGRGAASLAIHHR